MIRRIAAICVLAALGAILTASPVSAGGSRHIHPNRSCRAADLTAVKAINCYWPHASRARALRIAECESTASAPERIARERHLGRWAVEQVYGTHVGIFQLGEPERREYGWYTVGAPARIQVKSALGLYRRRGWEPWVCQG